ncbi:hydroxyacid dehydrogenase [Martelella mediterranea]|uniref:hydroxyacid dehydrogenase n=1 Tax=Martelella mediterranea TaxID=293089 RepID=UPI001E60DF91|nr:hydroxyacid dehydrogenase [Martelella mediterranea]MCD1634737.1 hydroxyacid dehydrogenase [Martelella mediterranea]
MSKTILVTGPDLAAEAKALAESHGYELVHMPAYSDSTVIADYMAKTGAVGIVSRMGRIDASVIEAAPQLRVISKHGVGVDNIDIVAAAKRGIPVLVATGANAVSVAEHTIALLLTVSKRILSLDRSLREGRWEKPGFQGRELNGGTMGLMGIGAIARATGVMAKGLGMTLIAYDPYAPDSAFEAVGARRCATPQELFSGSQVLSLHSPLTEATRNIVNAEALALMPKGSYVINTARGGLIDEQALLDAVVSGHIAGAGIDTFASEPPGPDHIFFSQPNIVMTPHIGGVTAEANARVGTEALRGIFQIIDGQPVAPERIINREFLAADAAHLTSVEK